MKRYVLLDDKIKQALKDGVDTLCDAVKITMGPSGQNVLIDVPGQNPVITKDGVTVAKAIELSNPLLGMGARIIRQASESTAEEAGDGTTTSCVLSQAIFSRGLRAIDAGNKQQKITSGIKEAANDIISELDNMSHKVQGLGDLYNIAKISVNGDEQLAKKITSAFEAVGDEGVVTVEEAKGLKTTVSIKEGYEITRGYASPYFINDEKTSKCILENPVVITAFQKFDTINPLTSVLGQCLNEERSILLICDDISDEALKGLVVNKVRANLKICVIRAPFIGVQRFEALKDIAAMTNGVLFDAGNDIKTFQEHMLGKCERVEISKKSCIIIGSDKDEKRIERRIDLIKNELKDSVEKSEQKMLKERLTKIRGKVAVLNVGGSTDVEIREKKDRVDDALCATSSAYKSGYIPGGGLALVNASLNLRENISQKNMTNPGYMLMLDACLEPFRQIIRNVGKSDEHILEKIKENRADDRNSLIGFNSKNGEYCDFLENGIIDPLLVTTCCVKNSSSAACMLLSVGCVLVSENQDIEDIYV